MRLAMLLDEPMAFGSTFAREAELSDEQWRERVTGGASWLAYDGTLPLGSVSLWQAPDEPATELEYRVAPVGPSPASHSLVTVNSEERT